MEAGDNMFLKGERVKSGNDLIKIISREDLNLILQISPRKAIYLCVCMYILYTKL